MSTLPKSILQFLQPFSSIFCTQKTFAKMIVLFSGFLLCSGGRTVCSCLKALGMHGERAFSNYHHVLNRCNWSALQGAEQVLKLLLTLKSGMLVLVVDEHLERRKGKNIKAKAIYRDAVASSSSWLVKCLGIHWVVLSCLISFPWSTRSFALPFFCVPVLPEDHPLHQKRKYRTGIDLLCQMLCVVRKWLPKESILIIGDGDYARVKLASTCTKLDMTLITRLRSDARLHDFPGSKKGLGRRRKRGKRLSKEDMAAAVTKINWYGGITKEVTSYVKKCIWYAGKPEVYIPVFAGWVQFRKNDEFILAAMGKDLNLTTKELVELYVKRWNLEVTFRECRDYLGLETQRQWSDLAITRTTPLIFCAYSLVVIIGHYLWKRKKVLPLKTAWYKKQKLTFSDLYKAVKMEVWKHRSDLGEKKESEKSLTEADALSEHLAAMGF